MEILRNAPTSHEWTPSILARESVLQIGMFLSVVLGFLAAQAWNSAIQSTIAKHKKDLNDEYVPWSYAIVITLLGILAMIGWASYSYRVRTHYSKAS